ncbi:MAG: type II toxin-antitoxin system VapC family toxin [Candidatus Bathyarchaeia archaeon]
MRFIDSNVFIHAFLIPRRTLTDNEQRVKDEAKAIVKRIEESEEVALTTVHLSEIVNLIEAGINLQKSLGFLEWIIASESIKVYPVAAKNYESAMLIAKDKDVSANDALAYLYMKTHGLKEIYSFDKHFDQFKDVKRLPM